MNDAIIQKLSRITPEEQEILAGRKTIDRSLYMDGSRDQISGEKLLTPGKQISLRPHTRFIHFPKHNHDYVEMVYMVKGETTHIVNGNRLTLHAGELLILGQNALQEILPAGKGDLAVNFIVRPAFFSGTLPFLGDEETPLKSFILNTLCGTGEVGYLYYQVSDVLPIQNLIENLLWTLINEVPNRRGINQMTMGLLFTQMLNYTDRLSFPTAEQGTLVSLLRYIEEHYSDGSLQEAAAQYHFELTALSRLIKRSTGKTYTELVQEKRLSQAAWLLKNTEKKVDEVARSVGYENLSYFHRIFAARFHCSPRRFRIANGEGPFL